MDYPKSVPSVGLVNGKFVDENPATGMPGSLIPASWGNAVTDELLNVLRAAGIQPDESEDNQLITALNTLCDFLRLKNKPTTLEGYGINDAIRKGEYGLGANAIAPSDIDSIGLPGGFYSWSEGNTSFNNYVGLVNIPYVVAGYSGQIGFRQGDTEPLIYVRGTETPGKWTPTRKLWHDGNLSPATQAQAEEGVDSSTWMTPLRVAQAIRGGGDVSKAINGYLVLPRSMGSLILQWGRVANAATGGTWTPFLIAFPNAVFTALSSAYGNGAPDLFEGSEIFDVTTSGFRIANTSNVGASWFAIGH
ncbi:gp53-like domain-containing protein [Pseudomonas fontis]|uniref:Putative tail fiber protein gp53-like C-terminal domain-containing protein n=1 Tax=Pseudomonas fontis TaxID=2942633 RepID=A0ABT5NPN2_9PSED|nr:hypothetical protein [Pseudomonas fontis]MDD0972446.1 hypothetical protein [Pseudomonas fontis]MDD0990097.1 hypothetical protein [Pseudomonas fontis]